MATIWFAIWLAAGAPPQAELQADAQRLAEVWARQRREIRSAQITAEHFVLKPTSFRQGVVETFLADVEDAVQRGVDPIDNEALTRSLPVVDRRAPGWQKLSVVIEEARLRATSQWQTPQGLPRVTILAFDGQHEVHWRDSALQANLYSGRTHMAIADLSWFRLIPCLPRDATVRPDLDEDSRLVVASEGWTMTVDRLSGLLREATLGDTRIWQHGTVEFPGGIKFPRLVVRLRYSGRLLNKVEIVKIGEARFNADLPADAFQVALPEGATVVDARGEGNQPEIYGLTAAVHNVAALARDGMNVNRNCHPLHELIVMKGPLTECKLLSSRCNTHQNRDLDRGQIEWFSATCTDPLCQVRDFNPHRPGAKVDLWVNMYQLACFVRTNDRGLTCERVVEYEPNFVNRPALRACLATDGK